jgi:predicted Zn-dependent peptidase
MQRVRDECGLTYGIYAHARDQLFMVQATFAPRLMARGISEMQKVVDHWKACNVADQELETQKTMLINSRTVAFDDPVQMATILHGESLRGVTYDEAAVRAVTVDQVHAAIQGLGELTLVKAGTF